MGVFSELRKQFIATIVGAILLVALTVARRPLGNINLFNALAFTADSHSDLKLASPRVDWNVRFLNAYKGPCFRTNLGSTCSVSAFLREPGGGRSPLKVLKDQTTTGQRSHYSIAECGGDLNVYSDDIASMTFRASNEADLPSPADTFIRIPEK